MSIRAIASRHAALFGLLLVLAMAARLLIPAGYMPGMAGGVPTLTLCGGTEPMPMAMPHMQSGHHGSGTSEPGRPTHADSPCAFASLGLAATPGVDPVLLAVSLAFMLALAISVAVPFAPRAGTRLRPPLRAPPART